MASADSGSIFPVCGSFSILPWLSHFRTTASLTPLLLAYARLDRCSAVSIKGITPSYREAVTFPVFQNVKTGTARVVAAPVISR